MNFRTELKGSYEVEGPVCENKRTGGLLKKMPRLTGTCGFDPRVQRIGAVDGRSDGQPRPHAAERRRLRRRRVAARGGGVAGDGLNRAPGHEIAWGKLLRAAGDLANLTMRLHG
jgi:hypothetical protein